MDTIAIITCITAMGSILINLLILCACQKMYTEYFKDKSMDNRNHIPKAKEQPE